MIHSTKTSLAPSGLPRGNDDLFNCQLGQETIWYNFFSLSITFFDVKCLFILLTPFTLGSIFIYNTTMLIECRYINTKWLYSTCCYYDFWYHIDLFWSQGRGWGRKIPCHSASMCSCHCLPKQHNPLLTHDSPKF